MICSVFLYYILDLFCSDYLTLKSLSSAVFHLLLSIISTLFHTLVQALVYFVLTLSTPTCGPLSPLFSLPNNLLVLPICVHGITYWSTINLDSQVN